MIPAKYRGLSEEFIMFYVDRLVLELLGLEPLKVPHAPHYIIVASHSSTALLGGYQASIGKGFKHISACFGTGKAAMPQLIRPISHPAHLPIFWLR